VGASRHWFGRRVVLLVVPRVDVLLTVVLGCELLDHFAGACAVGIVHSARCLPMDTFKSRRTYSMGTRASSGPCRLPGVSEGFCCSVGRRQFTPTIVRESGRVSVNKEKIYGFLE
jgi:hypothetical protein